MIWTILVENYEVDPPRDISAQFTYTIDDIRDFAARNTNFSKTIVLPGTARNKKVFGHVFEITSANTTTSGTNVGYNYNASRPAKCVILLDGIQVFKGILRIMEVIHDGPSIEVECVVFGELGGLVSAIGDGKLEDLDFSAYDHTFNETNVANSWSAAIGSSYYYPHIDYGYGVGYGFTGVFFPIENFRPAFHVREYLDKIITDAGYTWESTFFDTTFFKKLIIPFNGQYLGKEVSTVLSATDASLLIAYGYHVITFDTIGTNYFVTGTTGYTGSGNGNGHKFTWNRSEAVSVKLSFECDWSWSAYTAQSFFVYVVRNSTTTLGEVVYMGTFTGASGTATISEAIQVNAGDWLEIGITPQSGGAPGNLTLTDSALTIEGQPNVVIPVKNGETIAASDALPKNVFQKDFLASIIKMFNLYLYEDRDRAYHLKIEPYIDFYTPDEREDWGAKLDRSKPVRLKPMGELNSRIFEYKYKDDSDYYNDLYKKKWGETYGSFVHDTGLEGVKDKQTVEVIFSPTPSVQQKDRVIPAIYKESGGVAERTASNIRILVRSEDPINCETWFMTNAGTGAISATKTHYGYAGHLDDPDAPTLDINWGAPQEFFFTIVTGYLSANLFNVYWSFYISEITDKDSKVMTAYFKLSASDIYLLDFAKLYYIDGALWRLNKVHDYNTSGEETTKCELLKVLDME